MKINIGNNNKIENSNIGKNNSNSNPEEHNFYKIIIEIFVGITVSVIGGYILFKLNLN